MANENVILRAGPLRMRFENGELRCLTVGGREVVRRVYAAVRDRNWDTVPGVLSEVEIAQAGDSFRVSFRCTHQRGEVDFAWQGTLSGDASGKVSYRMEGAARKTFWKNRIGICTLIPPGCAGAAAWAAHAPLRAHQGCDGRREDCRLPEQVDPNQPVAPFENLRGAGYQAGDGLWVELDLEGDLFELEDQRNWSDASFKIYGTPLRQPSPVEMRAGTVVKQAVTVQVSGAPGRTTALPSSRPSRNGSKEEFEPQSVARLAVVKNRMYRLPEIGLEMAGHGGELNGREIQLLQALHPGHLRVDLDLTQAGWEERLALGAAQSRQLAASLWLGLVMDENCEAALMRAVDRAKELFAYPAAWIVLAKQEQFWGGTPLANLLELAAPYLGGAQRASGTRADLIFLLRSPVPRGEADAVVMRITPQVHAFDDETLVESLGVQAMMVRSAGAAHPGAAVWVSPLSLRQGFNPYASGPAAPVPAGELPGNVDPRQRELFAAAWTAGSLAALAEGGARAVTAYETSGWRGVMERGGGPALPERFGSRAGEVFPLFHILADAGEFRGGEVVGMSSSNALRAVGLGLHRQGRLRVIAAYFGKEGGRLQISGLPGGTWQLRRLDASRLEAARFQPEAYRAESEAAQVREGEIELAFDGPGTATLDRVG